MDSDNKPSTKRWFQNLSELNACLGSASFHMTMLIVLGVLSAFFRSAAPPERLSVVLGSGPGNLGGDAGKLEGDAAFEEALHESLSPQSKETLNAEAMFAMQAAPIADSANALLATSSAMDDARLADQLDLALGPQSLDGKSSKKGQGGHGTGDTGDGTGGGGDPNGQPGFFGIQSHGKSVVYVVDSSGSMNEQGKFKLACRELIKSISQLTSKKRFFVILFSDGTYPMDADEPVFATPDKIAQTRDWLDKVEPNGGTQPLGALLYAISMKPDEIYFLSDGQFDVSIVMQLKGANRGRPIPIHTIDLMNYQTTGLMKMLARRSGGRFRFVQ